MKKFFIIKDIEVNSYYWQFRLEYGFTHDIKESYLFKSEEEALKEMKLEFENFDDRIVQIIEIYKTP